MPLPGDESVGSAEYGVKNRCSEDPAEGTDRQSAPAHGERAADRPVTEMVLPVGPEDRVVAQGGGPHVQVRGQAGEGVRAALAEATVAVVEEDHGTEGSPRGTEATPGRRANSVIPVDLSFS